MKLHRIAVPLEKPFYYSSRLLSSAKKIFLVTFLLLFLLYGNANIKTATGNAGTGWGNASNWSPSGVPQNGDTAFVPSGITISVKGQIYSIPYPTIVIKIFGTLDFDPSGKIDLSSAGVIGIFYGAHLTTNGTSSEIITIGGIVKFNGQTDGDLTGPKYASASTGITPSGFFPGVLAIRLLSFNYKIVDQKVDLMWTAVEESDQDKYEVQRSDDSENWEVLSIILPKGLPDETLSYLFEDAPAANKINFYRLNLKSIDGSNKYSKVLAVNPHNASSALTIFPNPVNSFAKLQWADMNEKEIIINVLNNSGKRVITKTVTTGNFTSLDVNQLPNGIYNVLFIINKELKSSALMLVKK